MAIKSNFSRMLYQFLTVIFIKSPSSVVIPKCLMLLCGMCIRSVKLVIFLIRVGSGILQARFFFLTSSNKNLFHFSFHCLFAHFCMKSIDFSRLFSFFVYSAQSVFNHFFCYVKTNRDYGNQWRVFLSSNLLALRNKRLQSVFKYLLDELSNISSLFLDLQTYLSSFTRGLYIQTEKCHLKV